MGSSEIIYFDKYFIISNRINRIFLLYIINVLGFLYNIITQLTIRTNHAYITLLTLSSKKLWKNLIIYEQNIFVQSIAYFYIINYFTKLIKIKYYI